MSGFERMTSRDDTAGRCVPCGLVYTWKASRTRRLYMAFCPKCGLRLTQTCVGNMRRPRFAVVEPRFEVKP